MWEHSIENLLVNCILILTEYYDEFLPFYSYVCEHCQELPEQKQTHTCGYTSTLLWIYEHEINFVANIFFKMRYEK
jgi:hypothetical protein